VEEVAVFFRALSPMDILLDSGNDICIALVSVPMIRGLPTRRLVILALVTKTPDPVI